MQICVIQLNVMFTSVAIPASLFSTALHLPVDISWHAPVITVHVNVVYTSEHKLVVDGLQQDGLPGIVHKSCMQTSVTDTYHRNTPLYIIK